MLSWRGNLTIYLTTVEDSKGQMTTYNYKINLLFDETEGIAAPVLLFDTFFLFLCKLSRLRLRLYIHIYGKTF